jgi:hypothetical protein
MAVSRVQFDRATGEIGRLRRQVRGLTAEVVAVRDDVQVAKVDVGELKRSAKAAEPKEGGNGKAGQA